MDEIRAIKKGSVLYFYKDENNYAIYDFKDRSTKNTTNGKTRDITNLKKFFTGTRINDIIWEDKNYRKYVDYVRRKNPLKKNVGTLLLDLEKYSKAEQYFAVGINIDPYCSIGIPLSDFPKILIKAIIKFDYEIKYGMQKTIKAYTEKGGMDFYLKVVRYMYESDDFTEHDFSAVLDDLSHSYYGIESSYLYKLEKEYNCDYKRVIDYLFIDLYKNEGFAKRKPLYFLYDYIRMQKIMNPNGKIVKYPKFFSSVHDITVLNYNKNKIKYDKDMFKKQVDNSLSFNDKEYSVVVPNEPEDLKNEGIKLHHCVASYIGDVIAGRTQIIFMRFTNNTNIPYITLEVKHGEIRQARGLLNRNLDIEEYKFLKKYAKARNLKLTACSYFEE